MCYTMVNHKSQKLLIFFYTKVFSLCKLNVKEHIIPYIPRGKVSEENYHLVDALSLKWVQSSSKFIVLRTLANVG